MPSFGLLCTSRRLTSFDFCYCYELCTTVVFSCLDLGIASYQTVEKLDSKLKPV